MNFTQIKNLNELASFLPLLREMEQTMLHFSEEINAINERIIAFEGKKGATPGFVALRKRVETLENAIRQRDSSDMRGGTVE